MKCPKCEKEMTKGIVEVSNIIPNVHSVNTNITKDATVYLFIIPQIESKEENLCRLRLQIERFTTRYNM